MKDFQPGVTAPPFHVYCRSTTAPYFDENFGDVGERAARNADGRTYYVPADMTYEEWEKTFVDKTGESGIIKENNQKPITQIMDRAIANVPNVKVKGYNDEQCEFIQRQHKKLLEYARENNEHKEVAFVFDGDLKNRKAFTGTDNRLEFSGGLYGKDLFVMHNHPRNGSFSDTDIVFLLSNDNVKNFSIVKNNGNVEILTKTEMYDKETLINDFKRQYKKYVKTKNDGEIDRAVTKFIDKNKDMMVWNKSV